MKQDQKAPAKTETPESTSQVQKIRMRLRGHPVKLNGHITEFASDGSTFTVQFDGPIGVKKFWLWLKDTNIVIDAAPEKHASFGWQQPKGSQRWEVL